MDNFLKPSYAAAKSTLFAVSEKMDEEDIGKSMKNALFVLLYGTSLDFKR